MAFLVPNQGSAESIRSFAVPIDSVEALTGLDFFPWLPDGQEKKLEGSVCGDCWDWGKSNSRSSHRPVHQAQEVHSVVPDAAPDDFQCHGITKKGSRCRRKVKQAGGYCYQHGG
jgi:endonuclease G